MVRSEEETCGHEQKMFCSLAMGFPRNGGRATLHELDQKASGKGQEDHCTTSAARADDGEVAFQGLAVSSTVDDTAFAGEQRDSAIAMLVW